ncbi:MAG: hypothetical protein ABSC37_19945 [Xanthobacteraceae bacterium]
MIRSVLAIPHRPLRANSALSDQTEQVVTVNTAAAGGNASLLAQDE